jgi:hypothetical protein
MKKTKRTILFLESLENRVVPSNTQALLHSDHIADAAELMAETEPSQIHEGQVSETAASEVTRGATISDEMASAGSEEAHPAQAESQEHSNSDQAKQADKLIKASDEGASDDPALTNVANVDSSAVQSTETHDADSTKADSGKKTAHDLESSKAKDSQSDASNSSQAVSVVTSAADPDPAKGSKSDSNKNSGNDDKVSKNIPSSGSSQTATSLTDSSSTDNVNNGTDSGSAKSVGDTGKNSVTDKTNQGKSNNDHTQGTDTSTDARSTNGIPVVTAPQQPIEQAKLDARLANAERNAPAGDSATVPALGFTLDSQGSTAAFSSVAAVLTAKEAGSNLPLLVDAAIPVALPVLETLLPTGLGELALTDSLAPVAGDLIVGFLPVEQIALAPAMQGVLNQLDELGEQLVGATAAKWLYPIILTALAATTVYQLASRRRRQIRGQSIWAKDSGTWSSTWFPFLSSSIQE